MKTHLALVCEGEMESQVKYKGREGKVREGDIGPGRL